MSSNYPPPPHYQAPLPGSPFGQPPPGMPPPTPRKSFPWLWLFAGCGTLVLIVVVVIGIGGYIAYTKAKQKMAEAGIDPGMMQRNPALAAARIALSQNPDVEVVSFDEEKSTITVREKRTGKTLTLNAEDIQRGKIIVKDDGDGEEITVQANNSNSGLFEVKSKEGTFKVGGAVELPDWLPAYPGVTANGTSSMQSNDSSTGALNFRTDDSIDDVMSFYKERLESAGLKVTTHGALQQGKASTLFAKDPTSRRNASVTAFTTPQGTNVSVTFQSKQ